MVYYNPLDKQCKSILGAIKENTLITFRLKCSYDSCQIIFYSKDTDFIKKTEMVKNGDWFEATLSFDVGLYWYYFDFSNGVMAGVNSDLVAEECLQIEGFQLSVYSENYKVPAYLKGGVIYQIFPDRFNRGEKQKAIDSDKVLHKSWNETPVFLPNEDGEIVNNDFFGGDFLGIKEKLSYLKDLGVTAIYLNPIFKAFSNHRYDTCDYMQFDSLLGNEEDFLSLIKSADEFNIKIILDGVFNHTGADSIYFDKYGKYSNGATKSKNSPYYDWFDFINYPNDYHSWWGIKTLPQVKKEGGGFVDFITGENGVIEKYTKMGIGGWRLDVVDELPQSFSEKIRKAVKKVNKDAVIIGEVWEDATNKIAYDKRRRYFLGDELDSVMNYPLKNAILDYTINGNSLILARTIKEQIDHYPKDSLDILMNILSTHDTFRLLSSLSNIDVGNMSKMEMSKCILFGDNYNMAVKNLKIATLIQYTLYGVPSIYYGDEVGMQGYKDPLNRGTFPWGKEDEDILNWYKKLAKIRASYSAFVDGETQVINNKDGFIAYTRKSNDSNLLIAINNGQSDVTLSFNTTLLDILTNKKYTNNIVLKEKEYAILIKK